MRHFLLCLFVCCSSISYSQSIFEFDYYFDVDKVRERYYAFMLRNDDGTGIMRVRYQEHPKGPWIVVGMDILNIIMATKILMTISKRIALLLLSGDIILM